MHGDSEGTEMTLREEVSKLAHRAGGSFATRSNRVDHINRFVDHLKAANIQIRQVSQIKEKHVRSYVQARLDAGISKRSIQNELAGLRAVLREAGRSKLAEQLDNGKLGAGGTSRAGTKYAISEERLAVLATRVLELDVGVHACIELQRSLGLRAEEAVRSPQSLATWQKALSKGQKIMVVFGTKGGRPREIYPADIERALRAVEAARSVCDAQGGVLVAKPDLRAAMARYTRTMAKAGFVGVEAGHSLRYAFAVGQIQHYKALGFTDREATARTSTDLGHGDGRGRYVERVYSRTAPVG